MPSIDRGNAYTVLSSDWTGLSPHLIATFYPVEKFDIKEKNTIGWRRSENSIEVRAPITDGNVETTINWHSPFENTGIDQKFSSLSALLQAGGLTNVLGALSSMSESMPWLKEKLDAGAQAFRELEGKSNISKLNSTQIFNGLPPTKITVTAHFRAIKNAANEVQRPMDQLMQWALPQHLALDGLLNGIVTGNGGLFASKSPQIIAMQYAGMLFSPLVIESIPYPLNVPRDKDGNPLHAQITMSLGSLQALDKDDWVNVYKK